MPEIGYQDPFTGEHYTVDDERLIGTGNPPTVPGPIGHGRVAAQVITLTDDEAKAARKAAKDSKNRDRQGRAVMPQWGGGK